MIQDWTSCEQCRRFFANPIADPRRFCGWDCAAAWTVATGAQRGDRNPRWLGGVSGDNMRYRKRQKERYPLRESARRAVAYAVRWGKLIRLPCEQCGTTPTHGHHDDYEKPLEVRWLCRNCHDAHHAMGRE